MATPISHAQRLRAAGDAVLASAQEAQRWVKLSLEELPKDGQTLAMAAMEAECMARRAMDAFKSWASDKAAVPSGYRRVYALERGVSDPNMMADILYKDVTGNGSNTVRGTWSQFTGTK